MAVISTDYTPGLVLYAHFRQDANVWNGTAMVALAAADWATYDVALTEVAGTGYYQATVPAALPNGLYTLVVFQQAGAAPATTDARIGSEDGYWDGTTLSGPLTTGQLAADHGSGLYQTASPDSPSECRLYGYQHDGDEPVAGRWVYATLTNLPQTSGSTILESKTRKTASGSDGYWFIDLVRGKAYRVQIPEAGVDVTVTLPDAESVDLRTLL